MQANAGAMPAQRKKQGTVFGQQLVQDVMTVGGVVDPKSIRDEILQIGVPHGIRQQ